MNEQQWFLSLFSPSIQSHLSFFRRNSTIRYEIDQRQPTQNQDDTGDIFSAFLFGLSYAQHLLSSLNFHRANSTLIPRRMLHNASLLIPLQFRSFSSVSSSPLP